MNLRDANDHPAHMLGGVAIRAREIASDEMTMADAVGLASLSVWYERAGQALLNYERENDVVFAALDEETLEVVRVTYNHGNIEELEAFIDAVRDLLGLDDEDK